MSSPAAPDDALVPVAPGDSTDVVVSPRPGRRELANVVDELRSGGKRPNIARILRQAGNTDLGAMAGDLSSYKDAIASMLRDIADVEALGDSTLQDHGAKAAAVRRLFVMFMNREPQANEDVGTMMAEIHRVRETLVQREQDLIKQEGALTQTRRETELGTAMALSGHVGALEEEEISAASDRAGRADRLHGARMALAKRRAGHGVALRQTEDEGELALRAQELARKRGERPIAEDLLILAADERHAADVLKEAAQIRLDRAKDGIAGAVAVDENKRAKENHEANTANERNKNLSLYAMFLAQTVSGYLAAQGVHGMSLHPDSASSWIFPIGASAALNGTIFVATSQYLRQNWEMRKNPLLAAGFLAAAGLTAISGYTGAAREMIPETVLADAVKDRVVATTEFVEAARPVVAQKFTAPANSLVLDMKQAGAALYDEATGRGPSHQYGFRNHSIEALARYRVTVDTASRGLASAGMCDDLRLMATDYQALADRFQYEYEHPSQAGGFADTSFVTVDADGKKAYDMTFDSQVTACDAAYPLSPTELITSIDSDLASIREGLGDGSIQDTPQLNEHIRNLNASLQKLASALKLDTTKLADLASGVTPHTTEDGAPAGTAGEEDSDVDEEVAMDGLIAPDLKELEPMTYEALGLLVEHLVNFYEADWDHFSLKYPSMFVVASVIDQLGLILAMIAIATSKRVDQKNAAYIESLSRVQKGEERARGLLDRLKARLTPAAKPVDDDPLA